MQKIILLCCGLTLAVTLLVLLARKLNIAHPIFLVVAGLGLGFIPGIPDTRISPDLVFLIILPPVLFHGAYNTSWKALWKWRRIVSTMAIGYVLLTAVVVAFLSAALIPGFTLAEGFLLGAIVSPPDAAAATAVLQNIRLPKGLVNILEGESLLNDATSLILFSFAVMAVITKQFIWYHAAGNFVFVSVAGCGIGIVYGYLFYAIFKWMPTTSNLDIAMSLVFPYLAYLTAQYLHCSGVLAVVSGGLFLSYHNHYVQSFTSRLKSGAIWDSLTFILNAVVFFLIGLQLPHIIDSVKSVSLSKALIIGLIISAVVIGIRLIAGAATTLFTRFIGRYIKVAMKNPGWRNPFIVSIAGMRGVVSLASALSIPLLIPGGHGFPNRNLILFITYIVIIITLVGQGLALPQIIKVIKPEVYPGQDSDNTQIAKIELQLFKVAVSQLKGDYKKDMEENFMISNRAEFIEKKMQFLNDMQQKDAALLTDMDVIHRFRTVMTDVIESERRELHSFRKMDEFDDDVIRIIENRLDMDEQRLKEDV